MNRCCDRRRRAPLFAASVCAALLAASALVPRGSDTQSARRVLYKPTGEEATITGTTSFAGTPPERRRITMGHDSVCAAVSPKGSLSEDVIVRNGRLANVMVYVRGAALASLEFEMPGAEAVLERRKCLTVPHVLGVRAGQTLLLRNSDETAHNYNLQAVKNESFNRSITGREDLSVSFADEEHPVFVKCNLHPWEKAFVGVFAHPFFAVSGRDGAFTIDGLPPGRYTVVAWHERFGEQTAEVEVRARDYRHADFTFRESAGAR